MKGHASNVKVERGSTFTFARDLSYIVAILFRRAKFKCVPTYKLCNSGNPPLSESVPYRQKHGKKKRKREVQIPS